MNCHACRHALSARLDGEQRPDERAATDAHLAGCPDCRRWYDQAAELNRLVAAAAAPGDATGVDDAVLDAAPGPWRARLGHLLRWSLGALGVAQFLLGVAQITALAGRSHVHTEQVASAGHLWHESAAWNVAVGAGFAWIATRRGRPVGVLPILTVFVAVLALLSLQDVAAGRVQAGWLLSHGFLFAGYAVILLLGRPSLYFGEPPTDRGRRRWTLHEPDRYDTDRRVGRPAAGTLGAGTLGTRGGTPDTPAARYGDAA